MTFTPQEATGHSRLLDPPEAVEGPKACDFCGWVYHSAVTEDCPLCESECLSTRLVDELERLTLGTAEDRQAFKDEIHDHCLEHHEDREAIGAYYGKWEFDVVAAWLFISFLDRVTR